MLESHVLNWSQPIFQKTHLLSLKGFLAMMRQHDQLTVISVLTASVHDLLESLCGMGEVQVVLVLPEGDQGFRPYLFTPSFLRRAEP